MHPRAHVCMKLICRPGVPCLKVSRALSSVQSVPQPLQHFDSTARVPSQPKQIDPKMRSLASQDANIGDLICAYSHNNSSVNSDDPLGNRHAVDVPLGGSGGKEPVDVNRKLQEGAGRFEEGSGMASCYSYVQDCTKEQAEQTCLHKTVLFVRAGNRDEGACGI